MVRGEPTFPVPAIINLSSHSLALVLRPGSAAVPAFLMARNRDTRICVQMDEQDAESESANPAGNEVRTLCFSPALFKREIRYYVCLLWSHNASTTNNTKNEQAQLAGLAIKDGRGKYLLPHWYVISFIINSWDAVPIYLSAAAGHHCM